jgi:diguanylate cyclase (GGDEF)-like protein/PAS domain S-box-containing protein
MSSYWLSKEKKGAIFLFDEQSDKLVMTVQQGMQENQQSQCHYLPMGHCLCGRAGQSRNIIFASSSDERHEISMEGASPHGHYCVPILSSERLLGVIVVYLSDTRQSEPGDEEFLVAMANTVAGIIERKEAEQRQKLGNSVIKHSQEGIIITDTQVNIQMVNPAFSKITGYESGDVIGQNPSLLQSGRHDEEFYNQMWQSIHEADTWSGEVWSRRKSGDIYPEWISISAIKDGRGKVTNYVGILSDITERKAFEKQLKDLAFYDSLTGIPNRTLFNERLLQALKEAARHEQKLAVFFLDLDFFKQVNDTYGHKIGDMLLQEVSKRLLSLLREEDTVARLGGDEFAIILRTAESPEVAGLIATKIIELLTEPFILSGRECQIGTSIGISIFPEQATEPETLVKFADMAMYLAKKGGRNCYKFYGEEDK